MKISGRQFFFTDEPGVDKYNLPERFAEYLEYNLVKDKTSIREQDAYKALSLSIRDRLIRNWLRTQYNYTQNAVKKVYYLSLEFLMGRLLGNALVNLDFYNECYSIMKKLGYVLEDVREFENDMGLGNGGLGRLAACFIDSLSTLEFLHTDMVSGMNTVFLSRRLTMGINTNCRITGFNTVIRGKLSDRKYAIKSGLKGKSSRNGNPTGVGNSNGLIPKKYLLLLLMYRFRVTKIIP